MPVLPAAQPVEGNQFQYERQLKGQVQHLLKGRTKHQETEAKGVQEIPRGQ